MTLSVEVLGSSGMFATTERAASGYLLRFCDLNIWMDCGSGTWRNLLRSIEYAQIDGILVTHRHPDHTSDFFQAFHARRYGAAEPLPRIPLWAPTETIERIDAFTGELDEAFDLRAIDDGEELHLEDAVLSFHRMAHPPETLGVRLELDGNVVAYSSDTGPEADFQALSRDAELFICEATLQESDDLWEGHLRASQAGQIANDVGARRLLLTHLPPGRDAGLSLAEATRAAGPTEVQLAADHLRIEL